MIFDGLDEGWMLHRQKSLLTSSILQSISICSVMVTSREVGYSQARSMASIRRRRLSDFSDPDVALYAARWFGSIPELSKAEAKALAESFEARAPRPGSKKNPLMLALMATSIERALYPE